MNKTRHIKREPSEEDMGVDIVTVKIENTHCYQGSSSQANNVTIDRPGKESVVMEAPDFNVEVIKKEYELDGKLKTIKKEAFVDVEIEGCAANMGELCNSVTKLSDNVNHRKQFKGEPISPNFVQEELTIDVKTIKVERPEYPPSCFSSQSNDTRVTDYNVDIKKEYEVDTQIINIKKETFDDEIENSSNDELIKVENENKISYDINNFLSVKIERTVSDDERSRESEIIKNETGNVNAAQGINDINDGNEFNDTESAETDNSLSEAALSYSNWKLKSQLLEHVKSYGKNDAYSCQICSYKTFEQSCFNKHMINHATKDYKSLPNKNQNEPTPVKPKRIRNNLRLHECDQCEYKGSCKSQLLIHSRKHTGEKPYACNHCDFRSSYKSHLNRHVRGHTGEKPFACNLCDYRSKYKSKLITHIRQHTGDKPHACHLCDYRCTDRPNLVRHARLHTGEKPYACNLCDFRSTRKANLVIHSRYHTGDKPYVCDHCDYKSSDKARLIRHSKQHAGKNPSTSQKKKSGKNGK